jgi:hypothetical protein
VAAQGVEKRLNAAVDRAAEQRAVDLDLAHARRALDLAQGRDADELDLDSLHLKLFCHGLEPKRNFAALNPRNCRFSAGIVTSPAVLPPPMGIVPASGKELAFDEIRIDRYAGGRIVESWFIPDRFTMWSALGLIGTSKP